MYFKIFLNILLLIGLAIAQAAFINSLPSFIGQLNIAVVVLVWLLNLSSFNNVLWWSVGIGVIFDLYSFLPFGLHTISLLVAITLTYWLFENFLTNWSVYSFAALTLNV